MEKSVKEDLKIEEVAKEEVILDSIKEETHHKKCDVVFEKKGYIYFTFNGDTLRELGNFSLVPASVNVSYVGTYGKPDFRVIQVK